MCPEHTELKEVAQLVVRVGATIPGDRKMPQVVNVDFLQQERAHLLIPPCQTE